MTQIYLDHNATTPIDPAVLNAMDPYLREIYGNASSVDHSHGHAASLAVEQARENVAVSIGARAAEIIFTGSCTEADNLAIIGVARAFPDKRHFVTTQIEHPAILEPLRALESEGWRVTYLPVDEHGKVCVGDIAEAICDQTVLVSVMAANNEVGTLQPLREIGALCQNRGVLFHTDLAQYSAYGEIDVQRDNIHLASISGHKAYGPKGIGALYMRSRSPRVKLKPLIYGGGQEKGLRPGTLPTAAIVGLGEAMKIAKKRSVNDARLLRAMCNRAREEMFSRIEGISLNGHPSDRLANNLSFSVDGVDPMALMRRLREQISFSSSSACSTNKVETSHVLLAMFGHSDRARNAFRIAPGRFTSEEDMMVAVEALILEIRRLQGT